MPAPPPPKRHPYDQWSPDARALDLVGDKWTLLIIRDLAAGPRRFVELQRVLPGISTEQLRSRLNRMVADGLLTRKRYREVPPRVDYELTERSRDLMGVLAELARWGYEWVWGAPRPTERVDLGAIFRLAPGLLARAGRAGTVELVVRDPAREQEEARFALKLSPSGQAVVSELPKGSVAESALAPGRAEARIHGTRAAWIAVLTPGGDRSALAVEGDRPLAELVLDGLAASAPQRRRAVA
jgi:DNA-binding HxlR family transcriptional regulator